MSHPGKKGRNAAVSTRATDADGHKQHNNAMMVTKLWLSTFAFYSQFQFHPSACELYSLYTARGEKVSGKITILFHKNYHIIFSVYFTAVAVKKI